MRPQPGVHRRSHYPCGVPTGAMQTTSTLPATQTAADAAAAPRPVLSVFDGVMIITGVVIGGGIFALPPMVAGLAGSAEWMYGAWVLGAVLALVGALCYAELATSFPDAGGDYHFLTRAYGKDLSFFFAWARIMVITTGSIALLAYVFGDYMTRVLPLGAHSSTVYAVGVVALLTATNIAGLKQSSRAQNGMSGLLVLGMLVVVAAGFAAPEPVATAAVTTTPPTSVPTPELAAFGTALLFVLFTYGGWNEAAYISAEVRGGRSAIVRVLVLALALITAVYLLFVTALLLGLGFDGLKASQAVAADVAGLRFGPTGERLIGAIAALAALTSINATMIVAARTNYSLGADWPLFAFMNRWNGERGAPVTACVVTGVLSVALVGVAAMNQGGVKFMVEFTAPVFWFFFLLTGLALFVLRWRQPQVHRPFRVPLYPALPIVFVLTCAFLLYKSLQWALVNQAVQIALYVMAAGAVVWVVARLAARR
jgi:basic amino acid/polyamine antiporter, APA family